MLRSKWVRVGGMGLVAAGAAVILGSSTSPMVVVGHAQPGYQGPQAVTVSVKPVAVLEPADLPLAMEAPLGAPNVVPVRSPDPAARNAAQRGKGVRGPSIDRSTYPGAAPASEAPAGPDANANLPAVNFSFNGLSESGFIPPDQALAVGPNHVVEQNNSRIQVFNKTGTSALGPFSLQTWYSTPTNFVFDPVGVARKGASSASDGLRFYEVALFLSGSDSRIVLTVSSTNSGTSARCLYHLNGVIWGANTFSDFPKLGVTRDPNNLANSRILIGVNGFTLSGSFVNNAVLELPKQAIDNCAGFSYTNWVGFSDANDNSIAFTPVPSTDYDEAGGFGWYVVFARFGAGSGHTVWRNRFGAGFERFFIDTIDYANPPNATQAGSGALIDTIDDRMQSAVTRYGKTWVVHTVILGGCGAGNDTAVLHVTSIDTPHANVAPSLSKGPTVPTSPGFTPNLDFYQAGPCATHQFNGAISQDSHGNALYVYTESGNATFAHPRMNGFHLVENSIGPVVVLGAGPCACVETRGRWGDYSAASLDPLDQRFVWLASEILLGNNFWGTRIARTIWSGNPI